MTNNKFCKMQKQAWIEKFGLLLFQFLTGYREYSIKTDVLNQETEFYSLSEQSIIFLNCSYGTLYL